MAKSGDTRLLWLDYSNVIAMLFVVLFHIPSTLLQPVRSIEYVAVNVPFFLFTGVSFRLFLTRKWTGWRPFLQHQARTLLVPTVIFFAVFYTMWLAFGQQLADDNAAIFVPLLELLRGRPATVLATYWFVFCIFAMQIMLTALQRIIPDERLQAVLFGALPLLPALMPIPSEYQLSNAMNYMPMFALGWFVADKRYRCAILTAAVLVACQLPLTLQGCISSDVLIGEAIGTALAALIVCGAKWASRTPIALPTVYLLRHGALVLLATQNYIIGTTRMMADKMLGDNFLASHYVCKPIVLAIVYLASLPIIWGVLKYAPWILGKKRKVSTTD